MDMYTKTDISSNMSKQLLCTFSNDSNYKQNAEKLKKVYKLYNNRIFVFSNKIKPSELFLTYNVLTSDFNSHTKFPNTILIHRKQQTNTLFTINSLNKLIQDECGSRDPRYMIDWDLYKNSLILISNDYIKIINLELFTVIKQ